VETPPPPPLFPPTFLAAYTYLRSMPDLFSFVLSPGPTSFVNRLPNLLSPFQWMHTTPPFATVFSPSERSFPGLLRIFFPPLVVLQFV